MNKNCKFLVVILLSMVCLSCEKITWIEENVVLPKSVEMIEGQKIVMSGRLVQQSITSFVDHPVEVDVGGQYTISKWQVSDSEVLEVRGDTLIALSVGECEVVGNYIDKWIVHEVKCNISVLSSNLPIVNDTIYACVDDTVLFFDFWALPGHTINYTVEYENPSSEHGTINNMSTTLWETRGGCMVLSRFVEYDLPKVIREGMKAVCVNCDALGIDVRIPVVVSSIERKKEK